MWFSIKTLLSILRLSLDSWQQNESETKFNWHFSQFVSKNVTFFTNNIKHRQIIYRCKTFFVKSTNSGLLPQNKNLFGSDPITKFFIAQKYMPIIWVLLSKMKGTILKGNLWWTVWHLEWAMEVAGVRQSVAVNVRHLPRACSWSTTGSLQPWSCILPFWLPPSWFGWVVQQNGGQSWLVGWPPK